MKKNHLAGETSPYLLQHVENPVDWYPWGNEAIQAARHQDKPILLSIGYAACHWCHVMAHESFEDEEIAKLMNDLFINIKVDREERPDLDKVYQTAHYLLSQQAGGWPLTVFLTPDLLPFFSGTYFPKEARHGLPAFSQVLRTIATVYKEQKQGIEKQNQELMRILKQNITVTPGVLIDAVPIEQSLQILTVSFDEKNGGFNGAPKFPQAPKLMWLLHTSPGMVLTTLEHMLNGGIYDQLAGGFYRYSVDAHWIIPHFEKMLYDNAQLIDVLSVAHQLSGKNLFADAITKTVHWLCELQDACGCFYSSMDADSEGEEGKFYLWDQADFDRLLTNDENKVAKRYFGLDRAPNIEEKWHLVIASPISAIADSLNLSQTQVQDLIASAKQKLLQARQKRIPPFTDKKMLTAWNALLVKGLYRSGNLLNDTRLLDLADKVLHCVQENAWQHNRLNSLLLNKKKNGNGFLDDYIFLVDAILLSLQVRWRSKNLDFALELMEQVITHFSAEEGGFYFTSDEHEHVLYRPKMFMDEALPAGNGIALQCLLLLGHLLGREDYLQAAQKLLQAAWNHLSNYPAEHCSMLLGLKHFLSPPKMIIIRGQGEQLSLWWRRCQSLHHFVFAIPSDEANLPEALKLRSVKNEICAYICEGEVCSPPVFKLDELEKLIGSS